MARGKKIDWNKEIAPGYQGVDVEDLTEKKQEALHRLLLENRQKLKKRSESFQAKAADLNKKYFG